MNSEPFPKEQSAPSVEVYDSLASYLIDTSVDELCHLLARVVARLGAHEGETSLEQDAA